MDKVRLTFDDWAHSGRSELMEKEHTKTVITFLEYIKFKKPFTFLDVGCGNGWVVRKISKNSLCKKAIGIDKSKNMISNAKSKITSTKEKFFQADVQKWNYRGGFDYIFSMESIYYVESLEASLKKIYKLLNTNGYFFCGTDFYTENKATSRWSDMMKIPMHLRSKNEWMKLFKEAGFKTTTRQIKDPNNRKKWKREYGTLFLIGKKC